MAREPILVVDDHLLNIKLARAVLENADYEVHSAGDAATTFAQLEIVRPALILMDVRLPGMDGFELARRIKDDARYAEIPIIAMTASGIAPDREQVRRAGFDDYMTKPFDIDVLLATIERLVG